MREKILIKVCWLRRDDNTRHKSCSGWQGKGGEDKDDKKVREWW